jgi:hypothetical protein
MKRHGQIKVEVAVRGPEVAKWAANRHPVAVRVGPAMTVGNKLGVLSMFGGMQKDLPIEGWPDELQPSEVPYLDPKSEIVFVLLAPALEDLDGDDFHALGQRALAVVEEETALISTAAAFELRVEEL